ncbi:uncharacterized protein LOC109535222 isoform X2 [Dendroctonus ponderosae]|uniref:uncharacterized protein LOC109535222 isoform X2 n=1 Tax=Dendroctonus ponderosae TaxID=77166 RepID=UPI002035ED8C|nr:uncharacterized protein LOC109535222 isoform X2 [Dendroctonus ponderosae]
MIVTQLTIWLLFTIINVPIMTFVDCESIFPTRDQQVNLLDNVHELFEQIKEASTSEQNALEESFNDDMESSLNMAVLYKETLQELIILKLRSNSNAVCSFTAFDQMVIVGNRTTEQLEVCKTMGSPPLSITFIRAFA